ncbi:MAG: nucleotidyltransferase family protein [Desulfobulbaceae bacterium]|nr:nucleotidyltransferase family protein [Desulfobulbaceae bacterium]
MVLAAGLGTRLRPYTLLRPKPLFPILGEPLLLRIIKQLRESGFSPIIVNAYHLAEQIIALLADQPDITLQHEPMELGTGGGLRMALPHFADEPVLVTNGDIYHDIDYGAVYALHGQGDCPISLVMHDYPRFNKVTVVDDRICAFSASDKHPVASGGGFETLAFTGIHVVHPAVLRDIPPAVFSSIIDCYQGHLKAGGQIASIKVQGHFWTDIGTIGDYLDLHRTILSAEPPCFRLAETVDLGQNVRLDGWGYVGAGASLGTGAHLSRVVVWDGARIEQDAVLADCLLT